LPRPATEPRGSPPTSAQHVIVEPHSAGRLSPQKLIFAGDRIALRLEPGPLPAAIMGGVLLQDRLPERRGGERARPWSSR